MSLDYSPFVIIGWWAFQWKSLVANEVATQCKIWGIVSTDLIRNILRAQLSSDSILLSTSHLTLENFDKQRQEVSDLLKRTLPFYSDRWERLVIEWIHFSRDFLIESVQWWAAVFSLNNQLPWNERVSLKEKITPIGRVVDAKTGIESLIPLKSNTRGEGKSHTENAYLLRWKKYADIHAKLTWDMKEAWARVISFRDIEIAVRQIMQSIIT